MEISQQITDQSRATDSKSSATPKTQAQNSNGNPTYRPTNNCNTNDVHNKNTTFASVINSQNENILYAISESIVKII